jgi:hypothetical protein
VDDTAKTTPKACGLPPLFLRGNCHLQKLNCSVNCSARPSLRVLVIWPKFGFTKSRPGSANWGVLKRLIDSARNTNCLYDPRLQGLNTEAFTLLMPPLRKTLRPRFPALSVGWMKAKAVRGSNSRESSG